MMHGLLVVLGLLVTVVVLQAVDVKPLKDKKNDDDTIVDLIKVGDGGRALDVGGCCRWAGWHVA